MDDELQQLEAELKRLRPVAPAPPLAARIGRELAARRPGRLWWTWVALPAAAALAFVLVRPERPGTDAPKVVASPAPVPVVARAIFKPVAAENVLVEARDEGLVTLADGTAARRVRQSYIDTITWKDPHGRASLKWSVPREEERIVPVVFQ
jgi:hypothetical protein